MKTKLLLFTVLVLAMVTPSALAAADEAETNAHTRSGQLLAAPVEQSGSTNVPSGPADAPDDPDQSSDDYDSIMIAITHKFSSTLAAIAEAVTRGDLSSEQAKELSVEEYQISQMQFQLVSFWREIEQKDSARIPDAQAKLDPGQDNEVVMVALPFSSLRLDPSLAGYLNLTLSQVKAIRQVMAQEQQNIEPLMAELRITRAKLLTVSGQHTNANQVKALADTEASLLARLIVANARMQSKIYKILSPEQQKKLSDLEQTQGAVTSDGK